MSGAGLDLTRSAVPRFDRRFFASADLCAGIGDGAVGGKALGLLNAQAALGDLAVDSPWGMTIAIPRMIVLTTTVFDAFIEQNRLAPLAASGESDERIAHAFQRASLPVDVLGDLRALVGAVRTPLAVRSSSLLEDALHRPFAGVYGTKMIPNNQPEPDARFQRLTEAIKFVYASTFFRAARSYVRAAQRSPEDERMAVLIQEVVGRRHGERFYPTVSGVAKSYNFYARGGARPADGVVNLALGLGKTIVDGDRCWGYSPVLPAVAPPFGSPGQLLKESQTRFWAVNLGRPPAYDPTAEAEYLVHATLADAEYDDTLRFVASTYSPDSDRFVPGTGRDGPRALDFAPILTLRDPPLNDAVRALLERCGEAFGAAVEIEFALTLDRAATPPGRLGFLQARPMVVPEQVVEITAEEWSSPTVLVASEAALGNACEDAIADVVYVKPESFEARFTPVIAEQVARLNDQLTEQGRPYVLVGFGRWGSRDRWLGIPVGWGDVAGARVMVEATLPAMDVEASQGAHFFHNLSSFHVSYLTVHHEARPGIDWAWLGAQPAVAETEYVRWVRPPTPLRVKVDGRAARGAIWRRP
jgi:hypothetical protein